MLDNLEFVAKELRPNGHYLVMATERYLTPEQLSQAAKQLNAAFAGSQNPPYFVVTNGNWHLEEIEDGELEPKTEVTTEGGDGDSTEFSGAGSTTDGGDGETVGGTGGTSDDTSELLPDALEVSQRVDDSGDNPDTGDVATEGTNL